MPASNFGLLASDASWRTTWSAIIAGKFTSSLYSSLLFVEESTMYAELYDTDGYGHILAPYKRHYDPLGDRTTWSHIVPGYFGPSGFTGLLLYDRAAGFGRFYDGDGQGGFTLQGEHSLRNSWTHIVAGRFVASSPYSSVFFYSASENYGEIWATDGNGLVGHSPYQTFFARPGSAFTHILAGDFHGTPGYILSVPTLSDLFFYDRVGGSGEMYRCDLLTSGDSAILFDQPAATSNSLPRQATCVVAGNFGGFGDTDLAFYDGASGKLSFSSFRDTSDTTAELELREEQTGLRTTANLVVAGNFWMSNPEDHWFNDGPLVSSTPPYDPDWRFGTGGFSDLLFYDQNAGLGEFYFHEPIAPPAADLEGYITSQTLKKDGGVSTGSVIPGESIDFHVSSQRGPYSITIFRSGLFDDGSTEQTMTVIDGLPNDPAAFPIPRDAYKNGAHWPAVRTFVVPPWPSGLYFARVQTIDASPVTVDLPFVVRAPSGSQEGVLLVLADCTYEAYNSWGGRCSYGNNEAPAFPSASQFRVPFGFQLSFDRPLGLSPDNDNSENDNSPLGLEVPFIQWLARRGFPFDVCTSRDLHFDGPSPNDYRLLLFVGHHEYWTAGMRTNVETFAKLGGNVAFFAGNTCWWQVRLSSDGLQLICYKVAGFDPVSSNAFHALTTVHWFDDPVKRPETTLTGVSWYGGSIIKDQDHRFTVKRADHWVFRGTGLSDGAKFGDYVGSDGNQQSVAALETDRVQVNGPNGLNSPPNFITLASIYDLEKPDLEVGTMGIFMPDEKSGLVFNAGAEPWGHGLNHDKNSWNTIDQITFNVISRLGPWTSVSQGSSTPGGPVTAVPWGNNIALFIADPNGGIYTAFGDPQAGFGPWRSVSEGGSAPGGWVMATPWGNNIALFIADPNGGIYTALGDPNYAADRGNFAGFGGWRSVSEGGSTPGGRVTAVPWGNKIALFIADPSGGIYTALGDPNYAADHVDHGVTFAGFGGWRSVSEGGSAPGGSVMAIPWGNNIALFIADPSGGIYTALGDPNYAADHVDHGVTFAGFGGWRSVSEGGSAPGGSVMAIPWGNNIALFIADPSGGIYTALGDPNYAADHVDHGVTFAGFGGWRSVSEGSSAPGGSVMAIPWGNNIALFIADPSGGIYTALGDPNYAADHVDHGVTFAGFGGWGRIAGRRSIPGAPVVALLAAQKQIALFVADLAGGIYTTSNKTWITVPHFDLFSDF